jgi:hypothetical protein
MAATIHRSFGESPRATALRVTGLDQVPHFTNCHHVLNRNKWSARWLSRRLLGLLVAAFVPSDGPVVIRLDDTIEPRWRARIKSAASTAIRYAPHTAISSRQVACVGSHSCCCPRSAGPNVAGRGRRRSGRVAVGMPDEGLPFLTVLAPS